jgi:hypothetical protein
MRVRSGIVPVYQELLPVSRKKKKHLSVAPCSERAVENTDHLREAIVGQTSALSVAFPISTSTRCSLKKKPVEFARRFIDRSLYREIAFCPTNLALNSRVPANPLKSRKNVS